jgi:hypothetical protein
LLEAVTDIPDHEIESKYKLIAGMVRASFGIYNQFQDVDALIDALTQIIPRKNEFKQLYHVDKAGEYVHNTFQIEIENSFSVSESINTLLKI